jgi:hypothetical protein
MTKEIKLYLLPSIRIGRSGWFGKWSWKTESMLILEVLDNVLWEFVHIENNEKNVLVLNLYQIQETTTFS